MQIHERLKQDHDQQRQLAGRLAETSGNSPERQRLWSRFATEVRAHASAEEQTLYAALLQLPAARERIRSSVSEHEEVHRLVAELDEVDMSSPGWLVKFKKLKGVLEAHMLDEEREVFAVARPLLSEEDSTRMARTFEDRRVREAHRKGRAAPAAGTGSPTDRGGAGESTAADGPWNTRGRFDLPEELLPVMARAKKLEWITVGSMVLVVVAIYFVMGNSQAMKAAWIEDLLSFVAPVGFLVSAHYRDRAPDERFPYGYHRCVNIAFLSGSVALTLLGLFILGDSIHSLSSGRHPSIGSSEVFGHIVWSGWLMMAVLFFSVLPPLVLGRLKLGLARKLHDKTLQADADMNKADWLTALAGIVGVGGIGLGFWWADAAAGAFISASVLKDGVQNLRQVVANLMDSRPLDLDGEVSSVPNEVRAALRDLPGITAAEVRMREQGHVFTGEVFVEVSGPRALGQTLADVRRAASEVDWRVHDLVVELREPSSS